MTQVIRFLYRVIVYLWFLSFLLNHTHYNCIALSRFPPNFLAKEMPGSCILGAIQSELEYFSRSHSVSWVLLHTKDMCIISIRGASLHAFPLHFLCQCPSALEFGDLDQNSLLRENLTQLWTKPFQPASCQSSDCFTFAVTLQQLPACCFFPRNLAPAGAKSQSLRWMDVALPPWLEPAPRSRSSPHTPRCTWGVTTQLSPQYIQIMSLSSTFLLGSPSALSPLPVSPQPELAPRCPFWKALAAFCPSGNASLFTSFNRSG